MKAGKDKIIIDIIPPEQYTKSGLVIPDTAQVQQKYGRVISVGKYDTEKYGIINEGDIVSFGDYSIEPLGDLYVINPVLLYSKVVDGEHQALGSFVIVKLESKYTDKTTLGDKEIFLDAHYTEKGEDVFFDKRSRLVTTGKVLSVPTVQPLTSEGFRIKPVVSIGDTIYFRYMNTADSRSFLGKSISDYSKEEIIRVPYEDIFCIADDTITPVGDWCLGEPYIEGEGEIEEIDGYKAKVQKSASGLILSVNTKKSKNKAIVRYSGGLIDYPTNLKDGDLVYSKLGFGLEETIKDKSYYLFVESIQADCVLN